MDDHQADQGEARAAMKALKEGVPRGGLSSGEERQRRPEQCGDPRPEEGRPPGYGLLNLRASYPFSLVRLDAGVKNVLNKFYDLPLGGAFVGQGQTMSFNGTGSPWGTPVPGIGRTVYVAANLTF